MPNPRVIENLKGIENLETVIEWHKKAIEKLEIERIWTLKKLKELETLKNGLELLEKEKINVAIINIPEEVLLTYFFKICLLINKSTKRKNSLWKMCQNGINTQNAIIIIKKK